MKSATRMTLALVAAIALTGASSGGVPIGRDGLPPRQETNLVEEAKKALEQLDAEKLGSDTAYAALVVRHIDVVEPFIHDPDVRYGLNALRAVASLTQGNSVDARAASEKMIAAKSAESGSYFGAWVASLLEERADEGLLVIERAAAAIKDEAAQAELHELFHDEGVRYLYASLGSKSDARRQRLDEALAKISWPGPSRADERDSLRASAAEARLRRGDRTGAAAMVTLIEAPDPLLRLLIMKKYDGLFEPSLDRVARFRSAQTKQENLSATNIAAEPQNVRVMLTRILFLRSVGRDAEVIPLVQPLISDMDAVSEAGTDGFWAVNESAFALSTLGRHQEAIELMDRLLALGIDENPDLINMSINKGELLVAAGRYSDALEHARTIANNQAKHASEFGMLWVAQTRVCAKAGLGTLDGRDPDLDQLKKNRSTNEAAAMRALLCSNDMQEAERFLLSRLASEDPANALIAAQSYQTEKPLTGVGALIAERRAALLQRPAVQEAIAKIGRILPIPAARSYWGQF